MESSATSAAAIAPDPSVLASMRVVYVGGLADQVNEELMRAAFLPFGNIKGIVMPMDYVSGQRHKGFAFVEFDDADDASEAIFNRDGAELLGRTLRVSLAQPNQIAKLMTSSSSRSASTSTSQAVWKSEDWYQQYVASPEEGTLDEKRTKEQDAETLR